MLNLFKPQHLAKSYAILARWLQINLDVLLLCSQKRWWSDGHEKKRWYPLGSLKFLFWIKMYARFYSVLAALVSYCAVGVVLKKGVIVIRALYVKITINNLWAVFMKYIKKTHQNTNSVFALTNMFHNFAHHTTSRTFIAKWQLTMHHFIDRNIILRHFEFITKYIFPSNNKIQLAIPVGNSLTFVKTCWQIMS